MSNEEFFIVLDSKIAEGNSYYYINYVRHITCSISWCQFGVGPRIDREYFRSSNGLHHAIYFMLSGCVCNVLKEQANVARQNAWGKVDLTR